MLLLFVPRRRLLVHFATAALALATTIRCAPAQDELRHAVITTWTTDQGLPQNFIRAIAQTSDGFLWVGTMNGLARFDGLHFRTFNQDGPPELQDSITGLARDGADGLWIGTARGLFHYRDHQFEPIAVPGNPHTRIEALVASRDGGVWVHAGEKIWRSSGDALHPIDLPPGAASVRDFAVSTDRTLWLADGSSIYSIRDTSVATRYMLPGARVLYADDFGAIYAGDGHGLFRFDGSDFKRLDHPGLGNFVSLLVDHDHRLWMASGGLHGISRKSTGPAEVLTAADGLASDDVRQIFEDRDHDIWLGTISGLQRLHRGVFTTYSARDGLGGERSQVDSVFQQKNGAIWAGTLGGGIARLDGQRWRQYGPADGLTAGQVRGFAEDGAMPAIAISDYGIFMREFARKGQAFGKSPILPRDYINTPVRTADGALWFSIPHRGLFRLLGRQLKQFTAADGLADDSIWSITVDPKGVLWIGAGNQLLRWNQTRLESRMTTPGPVLGVVWPRSGGLVLGMLNGLQLKTAKGERTLTQPEGLPGNTVLDVIADDQDNLWLATARAISRVSREQWTAFAEGRADRVEPVIYTEADGLKSNAVLPLNEVTAMRGRDGRIWFATARGLSFVDPNLTNQPPVPAVLDSILVDDRERVPGDFVVAPGQHRITFAYTTPITAAPQQVKFRYRLIGWDKDWIDAGTSREVSYTALPPGDYQFKVIAINRDGLSSPSATMVSMRIKPNFWKTNWFLVLAICAIAAILVEITRRRTRVGAERLSLRFQERVAERERIAYEIHDTVIQDMIGAALQLELLGFQIADQPATAGGLLDSLAERMRDTIARSRNMVWSLHSTAVTQYNLVEVLRHAEAEFRLGVLPEFSLTSIGEARHVHPMVRDEVYRICREALANAFRHSNAKHVSVVVRFEPDALEVEIGDDGLGMDEETRLHGRPGHFGLPGMQAHAQRIAARISIDSTPSQGTHVVLRVKTRESLLRKLQRLLPARTRLGGEKDGDYRDRPGKLG